MNRNRFQRKTVSHEPRPPWYLSSIGVILGRIEELKALVLAGADFEAALQTGALRFAAGATLNFDVLQYAPFSALTARCAASADSKPTNAKPRPFFLSALRRGICTSVTPYCSKCFLSACSSQCGGRSWTKRRDVPSAILSI